MGISKTSTLFLLLFSLLLNPTSSADLFALVYKGCASNGGGGGGGGPASQQALSALSSALIAQSASSKFFKTSSSSTGQQIYGLFQCRGDLSSSDCAACVQRLLPMWPSLCGSSVAARVQLTGCYALYQVSGFPQVSGTQMLFKTCGSSSAGSGFEQKRDTAFANLQSGMTTANGFYATSYQSVYAMAQCEGDLSSSDCGECVSQAVQKSEVECGGVSSGQVYLDKCYISYNYYPDGVPHGGIGGGDGGIGASYVGLKEELPPCLDWSLGIDELMTGVSFASARSGFDPLTAQIGGVIPMPQQLSYFKDYLNKLDFTIGKDKRADIIKRAIFVVSAGTNDFICYSTLPLRHQSFSIEGYQGYILQNLRVLLQGLCDL